MEGKLLNAADQNSSDGRHVPVVVVSSSQQQSSPSQLPHSVGVVVSSPPTVVGFIATNGTDARPLAPVGRWLDGICDWPKNLFPSCWCALFCCNGIWISAQMAEKTGFARFQNVIAAYVFVWILTIISEILIQYYTGRSVDLVVWLPWIFATVFGIFLRLHIVRRDSIQDCGQSGSCLNTLGECCYGYWCYSCSVAQMARHLYGYNKVFDGDSDINRPDNYSRV